MSDDRCQNEGVRNKNKTTNTEHSKPKFQFSSFYNNNNNNNNNNNTK